MVKMGRMGLYRVTMWKGGKIRYSVLQHQSWKTTWILRTNVHSDIVNETNKTKTDPPIEVMNKAHDSVLMSSSPDPGQIFASVVKLTTNVFGKSNEVCAYLMGITKSAPKKLL